MMKSENIVAVFNVDTLNKSRSNLRILNMLKKQSPDIKSVIIIEKGGKFEEVFSIISSDTIKARLEGDS